MSLPKTARAAVVAEYGKPIEIRELPVPQETELEPGSLLVRVDVASVCGSDVHQWDGMTQALAPAQLPIVLGHEMMGTVVAFGPGPREDSIGQPLKEGDRLLWTHVYCGQCHECRVQHTPTLCRRKKQYMRTNCERFPYLVGGFAQYCYVFPPSGRVRIPDGVPDGVASAASCALRTVIHAFDRVGRIEPHQRVVIQGAGPLGLFATAVANHAGVSELIVVGAPERRLAHHTRSPRASTSSVRAAATPSSASSAARSRPCRPRSSSESRRPSSACSRPTSVSSGRLSSSYAARARATTSRAC
jgi:D-arabinose 1-dehydrogenase-like Zn-dependent alcohol dehydrogenase